jgi:DNA polymerase-4
MPDSPRKIIHIDADCFYAAIEMRDDPSLRSVPLAVGGTSDKRGVITTCNYQARAFGVRSAMPSATARRLCPQLRIVKTRFGAYREAAVAMRDIFRDYSDLVEPLSLDEAFIDVTDSLHCRASATLMAEEIRQRVAGSIGITVSAGVAPNKFLAKVASDWNKPDGITVIVPEAVESFIARLPVEKVFGVGRVTAARLHRMGASCCGDLQAFTQFELVEQFGSFGQRLYQLCRGVDQRPVKPSRRRKSLSVENTFGSNLHSLAECQRQLPALIEELHRRLAGLPPGFRIARAMVKVKFADFTQTTAEITADCADPGQLLALCTVAWNRRNEPVRLLGVGVCFLDAPGDSEQLELFVDQLGA